MKRPGGVRDAPSREAVGKLATEGLHSSWKAGEACLLQGQERAALEIQGIARDTEAVPDSQGVARDARAVYCMYCLDNAGEFWTMVMGLVMMHIHGTFVMN